MQNAAKVQSSDDCYTQFVFACLTTSSLHAPLIDTVLPCRHPPSRASLQWAKRAWQAGAVNHAEARLEALFGLCLLGLGRWVLLVRPINPRKKSCAA